MICAPHQYYSGDQIKKTEMGGACSNIWGRGGLHTGYRWVNLREGVHLEDLGVGRE